MYNISCSISTLHSRYINPEELRSRRIKAGHTQESLAEAVGVHRVTVARWESRGTSQLRRQHITALNAALNCQLREYAQPALSNMAAAELDLSHTAFDSDSVEAGELEGALLIWRALKRLNTARQGPANPEKRGPGKNGRPT